MGSRVEDLLSLARMLDEGKVSQEEYEVVKAELLAAPVEEWVDPEPEPVEVEEIEVPPDEEAELIPDSSGELDLAAIAEQWIEKAKALPASYRWGGGTVLVVLVGLLLFSGGESPPVRAAGLPAAPADVLAPVPSGSLGIRLGDVDEAWNDAGIPPRIQGAFSLTPEPGALDTFLYRFDDAAAIAGAYEPSEGWVYALMLRVGLGHGELGDLNSHLCHLLHPFDQACLDAFIGATGVTGAAAAEFEGRDHEATWSFEGNTWRLSISGDVETVRVIAPGKP